MDVRRLGVPGGTAAVSWALLGVLLSGCGSHSDRVSEANTSSLHSQVDAIREAAKAGDNDAAQSKLAELRSSIRQLSASGQLNPNDGMVLLTQVDRIAERIDARPTPTPTPTPKPAVVRVPAPAPKHGKGDEDDRKGPGKGRGHDE